MELIRKYLTDPSSGFEAPAAFLLESVQGEGGLNVASSRWFKELVDFAREIGSLIILDDVQAGCGRCGTFFSFETMRAVPDNDPEQECYVLYTSGSSGRPKGVPISQGNICAFLEAALPVYQVGANDRVYQGVSLSFDFAIEEIWPAWAAGATLIASERTLQPVAEELDELLRAERITVLCVVPTVLATLGKPWPELRQLVVSGEACPAELANRWALPGIRMLNAYGPTEITVSATIGGLHRNQPVTLGHALPHLRLSVRDANLILLPDGTMGRNSEISTLSHFDPTQLTLGEECFVADLAAVGVANHACGEMRMSPTVVGNRSFVGNGAVLPSGSTLHDGVLLGVYSCPTTPEVTRDCLGVPAFDLPGRETLEAADTLTFHPAWWRLLGRSTCDVLRILGPPTVLTISYVVWFHAAISWLGDWFTGCIYLTLIYLLLQLALVLFCMLAKWLVIGRYRPCVAAVWTHFVWRTQWITGWYEAIAVPALVDWLTGTPWWSGIHHGLARTRSRR
ncbi:MAG: aminotransferase class III-fold pyridoxal phosphate-dependent enzyme [Verrucomicrobiota bacterium]